MKHIHRSTITLIILLTLLLSAVAVFAIMLYRIRAASAYTLEVNAKIAAAFKQEEEFSALQKTITATDANRNTLASQFVSSEHIVDFLEALEGYGKSANTAFTLSTVDEEKDGKSLRVSFQLNGSFVAVHQFLLLLENAPYEIVLDQMTLSSSTETPAAGKNDSTTVWHLSGGLHLVSFTH